MVRNNFHVKFSKSSLAIAEFFVCIPLLASMLATITKKPDNLTSWFIALIPVLVAIFVFWVFISYLIIVKNGVLKYHSPFGKTKIIKISEIEKAWIETSFDRKDLAFTPFIRLMISPKINSGLEVFYINIKVMERNGVIKLLDVLPIEKGKNTKELSVVKKYFNNREKK